MCKHTLTPSLVALCNLKLGGPSEVRWHGPACGIMVGKHPKDSKRDPPERKQVVGLEPTRGWKPH